MDKNSIKIIPLGGLGEIGKNITAIEYKNEIIVIDCGVSFPDEDMYGVDLVIPEVSYLIERKDKVKGLFLTHGHEDHIGAIPYIIKQLNMPIYGTKLTLGLVESKLKEHNILDICKLNPVNAGDIVKLDNLSVEFIRATHSIADACSLAIFTPLGTIVHTGDFKIDYTPIDGLVMDLNRFSTLGDEGVLLLLADSTNVEREGHSISERVIGETLNRIFTNRKGRVIVATFASNIHRMQQIANASIKENRKIAFSGRSMENVSQVAIELGYLHIPEESLIDIDDINNYPNENITIITTGSQGEPMAGLSRIAHGSHKKIEIDKDDLFIISASPIPGNDKIISRVINQLFRKGVEVIYEALEDIHVSGHAYKEELKLIHTLVKPKYFMPVHGEYRHLKHHSDLAKKIGMDPKNVFTLETGQVLEINENGANSNNCVHTGVLYVEGSGGGDVGNIVLRDRKFLGNDGMVTIVLAINKFDYEIVAGPDVITRGFIYAR
ncbi:MAG: ribonuclease J, partial [Peptostreptococcaceae bacterium]